MKIENKTLLRIVVVLVALVLLLYAMIQPSNSNNTSRSGEYHNSDLGITIKYPKNLSLKEVSSSSKGDKAQPLILTFFSENAQILFVPSIRTKMDIKNEKAFYESFLFKDPAQTQNSRINIGDYSGFKSLVGFNESLYTVYKDINADSAITIRAQITASSTDSLLKHEGVFNEIIQSIGFNEL